MMGKRATTRIDEHCSQLGYDRVESKKEYKRLLKDLDVHFAAYEKRGNYIGRRDTLSDETLLCATSYLEEKSRGETFWPENDHGRPVWPRDQQFITNSIAHIIRRKGISSYTKRHSNPKQKREGEGTASLERTPKSGKKRRSNESDDEDLGLVENLQGLTETTVKPWNEPPKNPDPRLCSQYIQSLNPRADVTRVTNFTKEWLATKNSPWPEVADVKLQTFMHNRNFYVHYDYREDPPRELVNILWKGSEIETLDNGLLYVEFQNRIRDRVEYLTHQLTKDPFFVLEFRRDGAAQMTKPFANKWRRKEDFWELGDTDLVSALLVPTTPKPRLKSNKRQKTKASETAKSPVMFLNLSEQPITNPVKANLASMAETALQMVPHEPEDQEMADESMTDLAEQQGAVFVFDALAVTSPRTDDDQSRSISPENSIVVDSQRPAAEGSPNTSPDQSPAREQSWDALHSEVYPKDLDVIRGQGSPDTRQAAQASSPLSDLPNSGLSTFHIPVHIQPTMTDQRSSLNSTAPLSGETAQVASMPIHHAQMDSTSQQLLPSLLNAYPPRFALPPKPSGDTAPHLRGDRRPVDMSIPPTSSRPVRSEIQSSPESATRNPRPSTTPSVSSPTSPSRAFDKFLSHYGNRGSGPEILTSSKEPPPADSQVSIMSPKERIRAEKRAEVRAEAAEWEEIRSREKKSKPRTRSPPQAFTATQGDMPPPPVPASEPVRTEPEGTARKTISPSAEVVDSKLSSNSSPTDQPPMSITDFSTQVSSPSEKHQTPALSVHVTNTCPKDPPDVQHSRPSRSAAAAALSRTLIPSVSTTQNPNKRLRVPLLVPNLTKPLPPMVDKIRASTTAPTSNYRSYLSPYAAPTMLTIETCTDTPRLARPKKTATAPIASPADSPRPSVAQTVNVQENPSNLNTSTAPVVPDPTPESLTTPPSPGSTTAQSAPSVSHADCQPPLAPIVVQPQQAGPALARSSVTPNPPVSLTAPRSSSPPFPISSSSNISMGIAAATAKTLVTQTTEFLKKGGGDSPSIKDTAKEHEAILPKTSEPSQDLPPPRCGVYAHVPEPIPFSATPSEEEIAAIQAIQQPYGISNKPQPPINQQRAIVKSSLHSSRTKTLELLIESASGDMDCINGFSFDVVMNNTLSGFFSFYAGASGAPLGSFQQLIFMPTWPNCPTSRATKQMGESAFKKLKKVIQAWYKQAQKADPDEMEFQIMVQMG